MTCFANSYFSALALFYYSGDFQLARRVCRITESLISGNSNENSLRARSTVPLATIKLFFEPFQASCDFTLNG